MPTPQQQINYGNTANDGQGDPLRTAFIKTDDNFDAIWAAGPVGSNVSIANNTLQVLNTNGSLTLSPNGIGDIRVTRPVVPNLNNTHDLGAENNRFREIFVGTGGINVLGEISAGNLQVSNITNPFPISIQSNGNVWVFADNILRSPEQGSWESAVDTEYLNSNPNGYIYLQSYLSGNLVSRIEVEHSFVRITALNGQECSWQFNCSGVTEFPNYSFPYEDGNAGEVLKTDGAGTLYWDIDLTDYGNANVLALGESGWSGNIIPSGNGTYSLGNATNYWSNLWVANNTIYIGGVPLGVSGNVLTVNGEPVLSNDSDSSITTTGNITASSFVGNGAQLTNINSANIIGLSAVATSGSYSDLSGTPTNVSAFTNDAGYVTAATANVISVNGETGAVTIAIPTATSNLVNDSGFITAANVPTNVSAFTNDAGYVTAEVTGNFSATGNIIGANLVTNGNVAGNVLGFAIGYRDIPQISFTGNTTIATTDAGKHYYSTQNTNYTLTIANNASQGFQVGAAISVVNQGTGNITIAQGFGVSLYLAGNATAGNRTISTFGMATIMKVATDTWFINGTGVV
jgi:hypothetical protein